MIVLAIDTSTPWMCIALQKGDDIYETKRLNQNDHSSKLMPAVQQLMHQNQVAPKELTQIVVANGPGSYTGTRVGVTVAKTMAWGLEIPIKAISTLKSFAYFAINHKGIICALQDAKRGYVFASAYHAKQHELVEVIEASYIKLSDFLDYIQSEHQPLFIGIGLETYRDEIHARFNHSQILDDPGEFLTAKHLLKLAASEDSIMAHDVRPNYLRLTQAESNLKHINKVDQ